MAESVTNRGKYLLATVGVDNLDLRACIVTGTQTGIHNVDLDTVAELDAVASVSIHSERLALDTVTATQDDNNDRVNIDAANLSFAAASGVTAQAVAIYHEADSSDADRELISVHSTGFPQPVDGGLNVTINDFLRIS